MFMQIKTVDLIQIRNMPVPRDGKTKLPMPDHGYSTIVRICATRDGVRHVGLGEIRALNSLTGETPDKAYEIAQQLGRALVGLRLEEDDNPARATHALMDGVLRSEFGIAPETLLPERFYPAVRLGFDAALLDALARSRDESVASLLGAGQTTGPVQRNVHSRKFSKPSKILNSMMHGDHPTGWLRGRVDRSVKKSVSVLKAIALASGGDSDILEGVCYVINGGWTPKHVDVLTTQMSESAPLRQSSLKVLLEQPFPAYATGWYQDLLNRIAALDDPFLGRVRVMIEDGVRTAAGIERSAALMPHVDIKIVPQTHGSLFAIREALDRARALGFDGRIYLGNAGMNTELNSLLLASLALTMTQPPLFSADRKSEEPRPIRQFHPQLTTDPADRHRLFLPKGAGWGSELCRSSLEKRLRNCIRFSCNGIETKTTRLKAQLIAEAFDDSTLEIAHTREAATTDKDDNTTFTHEA
ncbi:hypothetical protein [Limimaricola cinnabarinus]|uniref:hypothetical protein n=1 Tax=Limimaricola cinnabarinus TaxID=1125964 RepID=UPI002491E972|nr:hypothetical protein [Limimaricola cinnabarinus]